MSVFIHCRVGDYPLEVNGHSVVGKSVEYVRSMLWWVPWRERVIITAMWAPLRDGCTTPPAIVQPSSV